MTSPASKPSPAFLRGGGELGELIAAFPWARTPMGPIESWPPHVRHSIALMLRSDVPMVALFGPEGVMVYNHGYSVVAGGRHPGLLGSPVREGWPEVADFNDNVMRVGLSGRTLSYQDQQLTLHRKGEPEQVWLNLDYSPILDGSGEPAGVLAIVVETTGKVQAERALRESNRRKDEFLAMLAHELRNPLAPIATASALIARAPRDEVAVQRMAEVLQRQVRHMSNLVDDLLDVSRVTRGLVEIERSAVDLKGVVQGALEQARPAMDAKGQRISVDVPAGEAWVVGDRTRLVQVLVNLLTNASKFTPDGGTVAVGVAVEGERALLTVQDSGSGIAPDLLPHVFDLFTQGERMPDRSQGGLGIGLALVKALVALHGGEASAHSEGNGRGALFRVALPLAEGPPATADGSRERHAPVAPLRILVTDDNVDAAHSIAALLEMDGHSVHVCFDARQALAWAPHEAPQVCVLDVGLPDMTGLELCARLRRLPHLHDTLFIALTGYGQAQDREATKKAGFHHHLVKPVEPEALEALLRERQAANG